MRIPYPTRIAPLHSATFAGILCVVQLLEGTPAYFSAYTFLFIFIATLAFNAAGGLSRPSGAYVFFNALLTVIVGLVVKAFLGEAAETNLFAPKTTMLVYVSGMAAMYAAVLAARRLTPKKAVLGDLGSPESWGSASIGCVLIGIVISILYSNLHGGKGTLSGIVSIAWQLNRFLPLGIIIGTMYTIRRSGGRRLWSLPVIFAALFMVIFFGVGTASKEGYFTPVLCVLLAAAVSRYNFSHREIAAGAAFMFVSFVYIVPFLQIDKGIETDFSGKIQFAIEYFTNTGNGAQEKAAHEIVPYEYYDDFVLHYYNEPEGFADREQMISIDDALNEVTDQGHVFGTYPVVFSFLNTIPHFIWPGKPSYEFGNMYRHEIGFNHYQRNGMDDDTTGISISPSADAYHQAKWYGVLLLAPALWFGAFFMLDWFCGDVRKAPWGLVAVVFTSHAAPEGMLAAAVGLMTYGVLGITVVSIMAAYVLPVVATLILGPGSRRVGPPMPRRPLRRQLPRPESSLPNQPI